LGAGHTFNEGSLEQWIYKRQDFDCPVCRKSFPIQPAKEFPQNFALEGQNRGGGICPISDQPYTSPTRMLGCGDAFGGDEDKSLPFMATVNDAKKCQLPNPRGGTRFAPPLDKALNYLRQGQLSHADLIPLVVFMSDGENTDKGATDNSLRAIKSELPASHFIYFGKDNDGKDNLKQVAAKINGEFHASVDGIALESTFTEIARGISQAR
jgi:hypothetical protein